MKTVYKSALGRTIDMDQVRLNNENVIAVGNMKVNARGDELGPGGAVVKSRNEVMNEYYRLNTPMVDASSPVVVAEEDVLSHHFEEENEEQLVDKRLRGSLAGSIAKSKE